MGSALGIVELNRNAIAQQVVNFLVGGHERHGLAPVEQLFQRLLNGLRWDIWIQSHGRFANAIHQDDVAFAGAARAVVQILTIFRVTIERVEAVQMLKLLHQRPLNLIFRNEVGHGRLIAFGHLLAEQPRGRGGSG